MQEYHEINSSFIAISSYGITTLTLNPSAIAAPCTIMSITYAWSNGVTTTIDRKIDISDINATNYAFPGDPGDPRNILVSQQYIPSSNSLTHYTIQVLVKYANQINKSLVSIIDVFLFQAPLYDDGLNSGYAKEIHLVANRVWDFNNKKMYIIETVSPNNVFIITPN